jgi:hypothetical protein
VQSFLRGDGAPQEVVDAITASRNQWITQGEALLLGEVLLEACKIAADANMNVLVAVPRVFLLALADRLLESGMEHRADGTMWLHGTRIVIGPPTQEEHVVFGWEPGTEPDGWKKKADAMVAELKRRLPD